MVSEEVSREAEHPPIVDRYGREWAWWDKDVYIHDGTLAFTRDAIQDPRLGLPSPECAANPNYSKLCAICRQDWPT